MSTVDSRLAGAVQWSRDVARRMDWMRGLRAATALSTPLLLADITGLTHLGWTALGGIEAIVSDAGGAYRTRLSRLCLLSFGGAAAIFIGTLAGNDLRWALPVTLLFCFAWTYSTVLGQPFASTALIIQVIFICGIGEPEPSWKEALLRAGFLLAGGAWATILSLFLWPLDPYRPARAAVADCYQALAGFLTSTATLQATPHSAEEWHQANLRHKIALRRLIERAWEFVSSVRAENMAETAPGRLLIVLLETADIILERSVALAEHAEAARSIPADTPCARAGLGFSNLEQLLGAIRSVAATLTSRRTSADTTALRNSLAAYPESLRNCLPKDDPDEQFLGQQLVEIAANLETALETASILRRGVAVAPATDLGPSPVGLGRNSLPAAAVSRDLPTAWERLTANWRRSSLSLRHAARVSLVCGFDVCLIEERHLGHGYWLMMTSLIVLQPHVSGTLNRGLQRMTGTVAGGILAAILALVLHSQFVTGIALFPLALLALALLPVNYAAYAFFLTPTFVLAFLRHTGDWQLAFIRIGNTLAGAAIAIAAMTVLFPAYERERIVSYLRASLVANRLYLEQLIANWQAANPDTRSLALARRATGLAHNDMEESLQRVLAERWAHKTSSESLLAFAAYLHRFSQSVTGLVSIPNAWDWKTSFDVQIRLAELERQLLLMEDRLGHSDDVLTRPDSAPLPLPLTPGLPSLDTATTASANPLGERQLTRLQRQVRVMGRHLDEISRQTSRIVA